MRATGPMTAWRVRIERSLIARWRPGLAGTVWPPPTAGAGWSDGVDLSYLQALMDRWRTGFDWRAQERILNRYPHHRAVVDGVDLHVVRVPGRGPAPLPL